MLIDSSVWIDYFRGGKKSEIIDSFIDENILCTNNLILSELIPALNHKGQHKLVKLLHEITNIPLTIDWSKIIKVQTLCLSKGINKIGIPDLILLDNVIQNDLILYSFDKHFSLIREHIDFKSFMV
ncbi:PIN domain-containing protein [candidate division KSB1 bacterium]|nr:PIN domain-containing protein [candidate division KSB1 bacterium]